MLQVAPEADESKTTLGGGFVHNDVPEGSFDAEHYRHYTVLNTDYRKFQDGLRMTVALTPERLSELTAMLDAAAARGVMRYGIAVQDSAVITCFVPQVTSDDHLHFLDGAGGGYAEAASQLEQQRARAAA